MPCLHSRLLKRVDLCAIFRRRYKSCRKFSRMAVTPIHTKGPTNEMCFYYYNYGP
jgi:hypothetical protein